MSSFVHGSKAGIKFGSAATPATQVDYSANFSSISFPQSRDTAETTTFTRTSKTYIPGLRDTTFSADGKFSTTMDGILQGLLGAGDVSFSYAPAGLGVVGTPIYTGNMFITSYQLTSAVGDADHFTVAFQVDGDVARAIQ